MDIIDKSPINSAYLLLIAWLSIIIGFDGYDIVIYGATVPALIEEWGISGVTAGAIGSYTAMGTVIGAFIFGILADKIGRKKVILITISMFSGFTVLSGFATGPVFFGITRILAGLGLGGVMPNVIALSTEFSPKRVRSTIVSVIFCGYSLGALGAALISRSILPTAGWEPIYWIAGIPLLLIPILIKELPESINYLLNKGENEKIKEILAKFNPEFDKTANVKFEKAVAKQPGSPVTKLFEHKRAFSTIMFWISCFSAFVLIYALNTWLPSLMMQVGYDLSSSLVFTAVLQLGAIVGTIVFGPLVDKLGFKKVLVPLYIAGALGLVYIGFSKVEAIVYVLIFIIGAASFGSQNLINAFVSQYYPNEIRSTGVGTTMGFGRIGGIAAPAIIGFVLSMNLMPQYNFVGIGIAAAIGAIAVLFIQEKYADYNKIADKQASREEVRNIAE